MTEPFRPQSVPLWVIPPRGGQGYPPPPTPETEQSLWECAMALWNGVERAMNGEGIGHEVVDAEVRLLARKVRRAVADVAAAYRLSGMLRSEALITAQRAAAARMALIAWRARVGIRLCPELETSDSAPGDTDVSPTAVHHR